MKILIRAPLNPFTGYGNDGIGIARALVQMGVDVYLQPTMVSPPLPPDVTQLLTKRLDAPFDLVLCHVDPLQVEVPDEVRRATDFVLAWTMWEWTTFDNIQPRDGHLPDPALSSFEERFANVDVVACYSDVTQRALASKLPEWPTRIVQQGGFWPEDWPVVEREWGEDRLSFCMVGALHERKDPFLAVKAWRELKEEHPVDFAGASMHFKTSVPGLHKGMEECYSKLFIHYDIWPEDILRQFYASQHVLISTSRGEGKNMPALEFMATGGTVIATDWGGHQEWLNKEYSYPLDCEEVPQKGFPDCMSSRADADHLKELMLHCFQNRAEIKHKGEIASRVIPLMCSWPSVIERLFRKVAAVDPRGQRLLDQLMSSASESGRR